MLAGRGITIEAVATSARDALVCLVDHRSSVVLVDVDLFPIPNALEVIARARELGALPIAFDSRPRPKTMLAVLGAGAHGYLTTDRSTQAWEHTISAVCRGEVAFSRAMARVVVDEWRSAVGGVPSPPVPLSKREWQVFARIAEGKTNRDIAAELCITAETTRNHVSHILAKLGLPNRTAAAVRYHGLVSGHGV